MGRALVIVGGVLILASSLPHALLGWPPSAEQLRAAGVAPDLVAGLAIGWHFGSAAMVALGGAALVSAPHLLTTPWAWRVPFVVGLVYTAFGLTALVYSSFSPQFLIFVTPGALLVTGAALSRRST